jgi:hypothetical protein
MCTVCLFRCSAVFYVISAVMCIYVIYKCLGWDFDQQQDLGNSSPQHRKKLSALWHVVSRKTQSTL